MDIKKILEEKKTALLRKKAELEVQAKNEAQIISEMKELNVTPATIDARIQELELKKSQFEEKAKVMLDDVEKVLGGAN